MTVSTTVSRVSYPGPGSGPFAYPFPIQLNRETDLLVIKRSAVGAETVLTYVTDYTVTGAGSLSGNVTLVVALVAGETIFIRRKPALKQGTSIRNQGPYNAATIEDEFDLLVMQLQSNADSIDRGLKLKETLPGGGSATELEPTVGQVVTGTGTGFTMAPIVTANGVVLPGQSRTVSTLSAYIANNALFNVLDYAPIGVTINNGVGDATSTILLAKGQAELIGGTVYFPPGTYKTSSNLIINGRWLGSGISTIIQPTSAVTICFDIRSGGFVDGFYLDGVNTSGKAGMDIGTAALTNIVTVQNCQIWRFAGVGGRGMKVAQLVTGFISSVYMAGNYINLHCNGGNTPTDTMFLNCQFRQATTKGVWLETGYGLRFIKPLFEANGEEGLYMQNVGGTLTEITVDDAWYENNWTSVASGAARHAKYNCVVDGANGPGGTIRFVHLCAKFLESATEARCMHLTNCTSYADFNTKCSNEAGQILVDGTTQGITFTAWNPQNGPFNITVTNSTGIPDAVLNVAGPLLLTNAALAYSAAMTPDVAAANGFDITATNATAFTLNAPVNPASKPLTITIRNTSGGGLGVATWNAIYKMSAWVQPATGFSRSITFKWNGTNWVEISRTPADVPN